MRGWLAKIQILIGVLLIALIVYFVDLNEFFKLIKSSNPAWLLAALFCLYASIYLKAFVLSFLAKKHASIPVNRIFGMNLIGVFFSRFMPGQIGGDVIKGFYFHQHLKSFKQSYAIIIIQRATGFFAMATIFVISLQVLLPFVTGLLILAGLFLFVGLMAYGYSLASRMDWGRNKFLSCIAENRFAKKIGEMLQAIMSYSEDKMLLVRIYLIGFLSSFIGLFPFYFASLAINGKSSVGHLFLSSAATTLSAIASLTPGNIGIFEGAFVGINELLGEATEESFAIALITRILYTLVGLTGGVLYIFSPVRPPVDKIRKDTENEGGEGDE